MTKKYAIGDFHGGFKALKQCLKLSNFDYEKDKLFFMGDLCDGWSEFVECIDELNKIKNKVNIFGNHDEMALNYVNGKIDRDSYSIWVKHGGDVTKKIFDTVPGAKEKFVEFCKQSVMYHIENNMCFVHAGIAFRTPVDKLPSYFYNWDRSMVEMIVNDKMGFGYADESKLINSCKYSKVFVGHTQTTSRHYYQDFAGTKPFIHKFLRAIDTGAAFMGPMTIMNVETDEYWQSDPVYTLYPNEKGRN